MSNALSTNMELINETATHQRIYLEPWGETLSMPPGAYWVVEAISIAHGCLTVSLHPDGTAVTSEPGAFTRVYSKEKGCTIWQST